MTILFHSAMIQSLLLMPLCLGLYISYRVMKVTDLTVQGTFVLGGAVFARMVSLQLNQTLALGLGLVAGAVFGLCVALMQRVTKLEALITSILALFMLFSINYAVMGRPNISLLNSPVFLQQLQMQQPMMLLVSLLGVSIVCAVGLLLFLKTDKGMLLRAYGDNRRVIKKLNKNPFGLLLIGMAISNGLAALSGIMTAEVNGYADVNMGFGVALTAIGAMIIGMTIMPQLRGQGRAYHSAIELIGCGVGIFLYCIAMNVLLSMNVNPIYLKFFLGLLLLGFLSSSQYATKGVRYE